MPRVMRIRSARWALRTLSLLTIAGLVVAPTCAPLCAVQHCGRADASTAANGICHRAGIMHHEALLVHGTRNCNLPELPAIVSISTPFGGVSSESRFSTPGAITLAVEQGNLTPGALLSNSWFIRPHDSSSGFVFVPSGVLRI